MRSGWTRIWSLKIRTGLKFMRLQVVGAGRWGVVPGGLSCGTGQGNCRAQIVKQTWPESGGEMNEPNNFLVDGWVSGGVVALA